MPELRVRLLGGLEVDGMARHEVGSRKGRTLLAALALARGRPVSSDRLVDILWSDRLPARPKEQLGVLVSRLRGVLGADRLPRVGSGYQLNHEWLDVTEVETRVNQAASRSSGTPSAAGAAAAAALALVRGPLLPEEEGDWVETERAAVDRLVAQAHFLAAEAALAGGEPMIAAGEAAKALDADPYDEAALRVLMRAHVAAGRPGSALGAYARAREQLAEDLGTSPGPATEELHTAIVRRELAEVGVAGARQVERPQVVGRDREIGWLDQQLDELRGGGGRIVVVEGDAGIGKTTLVRRWAAGVSDGFVMMAACDELGRDLPLQPVIDGLDAHLAGLSSEEVGAVLGPQRDLIGPLLTTPLIESSATRHTQLSDLAAARSALFAALLVVVERAADGRAVVMVIDDAHLAGDVTLAWLHFAVRRGRRLLVVATRRLGESTTVPADDACLLGPLDLHSAAALVGAQRAAELHRRSGGHPLFLVALGHTGDTAAAGLSTTITEAVERQVDMLGPSASTLRAASVLGPQVDVALLADILGRAPAALLDDLETATRTGILVERSGGFAFAHELVREAMAVSISAARRALLHREAARALSLRSDADVEPLSVAHHARRGGDTELAAQALMEAARHASERSDYFGAVKLLDDAVELADGVDVRLARARARLSVQDLDGAASDAEIAIASGAGVTGFELAGWISYYRREFDAALRFAEEGAARSDDPELRGSCLLLAGRVLHSNGDLAAAEARLTDAAAIAPAPLRPLVAIWFGDLRVFQGRWREAADQVDRALLDRTQLVHPFALPHALMTRLRAAALGGRVAMALAATAETLAEMERLGQLGARYLPGACNYRAWVLRHLGQTAEADDLNERARTLTSASGMEEPFNHATLDLADGCLLADDLDGAGRYLGQLRGLGGGHSNGQGIEVPAMAWHQTERTALIESRLALAQGRDEDAGRLAADLAARAEQRSSIRHARFARVVGALARLDAGEPPASVDLEALLAQLDQVAGLEAWRLAAEMARRLGSEASRQGTERRAASLLAATPPEHRRSLERWMRQWLHWLGDLR